MKDLDRIHGNETHQAGSGQCLREGAFAPEELLAEVRAVLLGDRLEIGSEIESHGADLGHWDELLNESPRVLFQVLSEARYAADLICPEPAIAIPVEGIPAGAPA